MPPPTNQRTHTYTHSTLSHSQGESRKQLEKQIVAGSPGPLALIYDWTFTWMNAVLTLVFQLQSEGTKTSAIAQT